MFKDKLSLVPHKPGSYQMKNSDGIIIYVGKAKDLNKRLASYFRGTHTGKTAKMVSEIADLTYIVANSALEAFIMEITLIKQYIIMSPPPAHLSAACLPAWRYELSLRPHAPWQLPNHGWRAFRHGPGRVRPNRRRTP